MSDALDAIIGQTDAVNAIRRSLRLRAFNAGARHLPLAFVFAGPEGAGKGFTANCLAQLGEHSRPILRIPMGTYQGDNEAAGLIGLRPIYSSARPGLLTSFVREHPDALVIFENVDQAHPNVQDVLAPMLARGELVDQCGFHENGNKQAKLIAPPEVDFSQTLLVFTTARGERVYRDEHWLEQVASKPGLLTTALIQEMASETSDRYAKDQKVFGCALMAELTNAEWVLFRRFDLDALLGIAWEQFQQLEIMAQQAGFERIWLGDAQDPDGRLFLTAAVLATGPEPKPALLEAVDLARQFLAPALDFPAAGKLSIRLSDAARLSLQSILEQLGDAPLRNLFRQQWVLSARVGVAADPAGGVQVTVDDCSASRIPRRQDFGGAGLAVDLPEQRFSDIAGHLEAKRRLSEVIGMLRQPQQLAHWDVEAPRGMLLWGPPGTGKTMLARAFACEADLPFVPTTGTEMLDPNRIRHVFSLARKYAPAAIFIDEIDALGRRDEGGAIHAINQLLAEIDGFEGQGEGRLFVIAASNLPQRVDPAITRSGRLDLHIHVPALDMPARRYFIDRLRSMARLAKNDWESIVELSVGMTGADLEKLRRELAYDLLRQGRQRVTRNEIVEHINTIKYGVRDTRERTREEMEHVAYHEAGHLLLSQLLNPDVKIRNVSLTPRGSTNGFVEFDMESLMNRRMTKKEVKEMLIILMGGRAAQIVKFGEDGIDVGAADDLRKARELATRAIEEWGMGSISLRNAIAEIDQWLENALQRALILLQEHDPALEQQMALLVRD